MADSVDRMHGLQAECVQLWKFIDCIHRLFGSPAGPDAQAQALRIEQLKTRIARLRELRDSKSIADIIHAFEQERGIASKKKDEWRQPPFPVRCDDATLEALALRVEHGPPVFLTKAEVEMYFDFSRFFVFWEWIPEYTKFLFAFGIHWSYPDADLFRSMAFFHDEAFRAFQDVESALSEMGKRRDHRAGLFRGLAMKKMWACQTVANACFLVEAFLNGLASAAVTKSGGSLSEEHRLKLRELRKDKNGALKPNRFSTEDKLVEWVKLLSPRGLGLERGKKPHQDYQEIELLRHSIVHLADSKVGTYEAIGHEEASRAADVAIAVIREICRCLSVDPARPSYPGWFKDRGPAGLFQSDSDGGASSD